MSGLINDIATRNTRHHPEFPVGTKMIFNQTAAPTGWTKSTSSDDVALRLVSGSVGTGGSVAFETALASQTPTISTPTISTPTISTPTITMTNAAFTLAAAHIPSHGHSNPGNPRYWYDSNNRYTSGVASGDDINYSNGTTASWGDGGSHTHTNSASSSTPTSSQPTSSTPTSSAINLDVSYVDVIIATKD